MTLMVDRCKMQLFNENHNTCSLNFNGLFWHTTASTHKTSSTICAKSNVAISLELKSQICQPKMKDYFIDKL
jgi:hypothetical protein